jgi:hypothetical protein
MEIGRQIAGTGNPNSTGYGQLYHAQIGTMVRTDDYVFAVHQQDGIKIIDPDADTVIQTIAPPKYMSSNGTETTGGFGSIVRSKDGNLWISMAANTSGSGATLPYILKINPYTIRTDNMPDIWTGKMHDTRTETSLKINPPVFQIDTIQIPNDSGIEDVPNSWYAWTADGFCASARENKLYWSGNNGNSWFKGRRIFCYDIDSNTFTKIFDFEQMPGGWILYGTGFRLHPVTDELYCSLFHEFQDPTYETVRISNTGELLQEYPMITNYWFPAMPVFPDNHAPVVADIPELTCPGGQPLVIPLNDYATDADNQNAAIVKTVVANTAPAVFEATVFNGSLIIKPLDSRGGTGMITLRFNSNGKTADRNVPVKITATDTGLPVIPGVSRDIQIANNTLIINNLDNFTIAIYTVNGLKVKEIHVHGNSHAEPLALKSGIYILQARNGHETISKKIIIR